MTRLDAILDHARSTLAALRPRRVELERAAAATPAPSDFAAALRGRSVALVAEVKRRSPSAGAINAGLDPVGLATAYAAGGAAAISVLTDEPHFGGSLRDLELVAGAVSRPLLRKDFILGEEPLLEARATGASAALLIVRALDQPALQRLVAFAFAIGLTPLVEAHSAAEIDRALLAGATVIGVNARDLDTFRIDTAAAWQLLAMIPADRIAVAESGMEGLGDVNQAAAAGADAVLIGSALARSPDPAGAVRALAQVPRRGR